MRRLPFRLILTVALILSILGGNLQGVAATPATLGVDGPPGNTQPVAVDDSGYVIAEDGVLAIGDQDDGVLANDEDAEGSALTAAIDTPPANGNVTLNPDGTFTYTPDPDFNGTDTFTYTATDDGRVPTIVVARPDITTVIVTSETEAAQLNVLDNDSTTGIGLVVQNPGTYVGNYGTLVLNQDGTATYTPSGDPPRDSGPAHDVFPYTAINDQGVTDTSTVTFRVAFAPTAQSDSYFTIEDTTLTMPAPGVLANDSDPDGTTLGAILSAGPSHGTLTLNPNGSFVYAPDADYSGTDSFTYQVRDADNISSNMTTVILIVIPVNDVPVANPDVYETNENTPLMVSSAMLLSNDVDVEGDRLTVTRVTQPGYGTATLSPNGVLPYSPDTTYNGIDRIPYTAYDGAAHSIPTTVSISVLPVASSATVLTETDADRAVASDADLSRALVPLSLGIQETDADAAAMGAADKEHQSFLATTIGVSRRAVAPNHSEVGALDVAGVPTQPTPLTSEPATVTITVTPVNDAPVIDETSAQNRTLEATSSAGAVFIPGVTASDVDGTTPTVSCTPATGTTVPRGTTSVTCVASDGVLTDTATFTVRVVDTTGPVIRLIGGPQPNAAYTQATLPGPPVCDTSDSASVVTQCTITGYSTAVGRHTLTVRARDTAGNSSVVTQSYTVVAGTTPTSTPLPPTSTPVTPRPTTPTANPTTPAVPPTTRPTRPATTAPTQPSTSTPAPTRPPRR